MRRTPIHPGEILEDELEVLGLTPSRLAQILQVPPNRLYKLIAGKRRLTADTALRLARYFGTSARFWMNLQTAYDLDVARGELGSQVENIPQRQSPMPEKQGAAGV